jgi:hypothetical protein
MKGKGIFEVPVAKIEVIQGLLTRIYTHTIEEKVQEYQEAMAEGSRVPTHHSMGQGRALLAY